MPVSYFAPPSIPLSIPLFNPLSIPLSNPAATPALPPVNLADLTAKQVAGLLLAPPARLLIDCGSLLLPHPLGVCRFVAQLLQLRQRGTRLWLCNLHPGLRRCLHRLGLGSLFHLSG